MTICSFCEKKYKEYLVFLTKDIECFVHEIHLKEIYYDEDTGICEPCRKSKVFGDPVFMIRSWLSVSTKLELIKNKLKRKGDDFKHIDKALERIKERERKLEQTPEVKKLYMENNPAMFKKIPKEKKPCGYCGENHGQVWINDPNERKPKIENCWFVCKPCKKLIELQGEHAFLSGVNTMLKEKGVETKKGDKRIKNLEKQIGDIAHEDGQEIACFSIEKNGDKFNTKKIY